MAHGWLLRTGNSDPSTPTMSFMASSLLSPTAAESPPQILKYAPSAIWRTLPLRSTSTRKRRIWEENYCVFGVCKMRVFINHREMGVGLVGRCTIER